MCVYILVTAARGPLASAPMTTDLRLLALPLLIPLRIYYAVTAYSKMAGCNIA